MGARPGFESTLKLTWSSVVNEHIHAHICTQVTQCLGLLAPVGEWYMAVGAPTNSVEAYPKEEDLRVFKIPHGVFIKMHKVRGSHQIDCYCLRLSVSRSTAVGHV